MIYAEEKVCGCTLESFQCEIITLLFILSGQMTYLMKSRYEGSTDTLLQIHSAIYEIFINSRGWQEMQSQSFLIFDKCSLLSRPDISGY